MSHGDRVTLYRGGFFSSLVYGLCGVIGVAVICAMCVGLYGLNVVDRKFDQALFTGREIVSALPEVRESLPPILADVINDRRAPEYRGQLEVKATVTPSQDGRSASVLLETTNNGSLMVTLLAVRISLEDRSGRLVKSKGVYVATPLAIDDEWNGPILSGATRRQTFRIHGVSSDVLPRIEVCDIRVWELQESESDLAG